jgi:hypothetical protein
MINCEGRAELPIVQIRVGQGLDKLAKVFLSSIRSAMFIILRENLAASSGGATWFRESRRNVSLSREANRLAEGGNS